MGKAFVGYAQPAASHSTSSATAKYFAAGQAGDGGGGGDVNTTTESHVQVVCGVAGTFSGLSVLSDHTGDTVWLRKSGGNATQNVTTTAGTIVVAATDTDAFAATDTFNFGYFSSSNTNNAITAGLTFSATAGHACHYVSFRGDGFEPAGNTTNYAQLGGWLGAVPSATARQTVCRVAGNLTNAQCYISLNSSGNTSTVNSYINGSTGSISISLPANTTGLFKDTSHTDSISGNQTACWQFNTGTGGDVTLQFVAGTIVAALGASNDVFGGTGNFTGTFASGNSTFAAIVGGSDNTGGIANITRTQVMHGFVGNSTGLRGYVSTNTFTGTGHINYQINAANATQVLNVTATTTGLFSDTSHTDNFASTDLVNLAVNGGTAGNITLTWTGMTETYLSSGAMSRSFGTIF